MGGDLPGFHARRGAGRDGAEELGRGRVTQKLIEQLAQDPSWNGGWYYDKAAWRRS
jgi:hypothetical protein